MGGQVKKTTKNKKNQNKNIHKKKPQQQQQKKHSLQTCDPRALTFKAVIKCSASAQQMNKITQYDFIHEEIFQNKQN